MQKKEEIQGSIYSLELFKEDDNQKHLLGAVCGYMNKQGVD